MRYFASAGMVILTILGLAASLSGEWVWEQKRGIGVLQMPAFYIQGVYKGGPADNAGLRQGDIIFKVDGADVVHKMMEFGPLALRDLMDEKKIGETMTLTFLRLNPETLQLEEHTKTIEVGYYSFRVDENNWINLEDIRQ